MLTKIYFVVAVVFKQFIAIHLSEAERQLSLIDSMEGINRKKRMVEIFLLSSVNLFCISSKRKEEEKKVLWGQTLSRISSLFGCFGLSRVKGLKNKKCKNRRMTTTKIFYSFPQLKHRPTFKRIYSGNQAFIYFLLYTSDKKKSANLVVMG